jgi:hypothetical protein
VHKANKAAGTVATLLNLAAIRIENPVAEINTRLAWFFNQQNLIAADSKIPVGQKTQLRRSQRNLLTNAVQDNKVVAQTVHFREFEFHKRPH